MRKKSKPKRKKSITTKRVQATENQPAPKPAQVVAFPVEPDSEPWDDEGLTRRQKLFVLALAGPAAGVGWPPAQMAGYRDDNYDSLKVTASQILTYPNVQAAVAREMARKLMTPEWATNRLFELASSSMRNFLSVDAEGNMSVDWKKAAEAGAIGQIAEINEQVMETESGIRAVSRKFKLHSPVKALETILKLTGRLVDTKNVNLKVDLTKLSDDELTTLRTIHEKLGGRMDSASVRN
jgi:hypothetical protein